MLLAAVAKVIHEDMTGALVDVGGHVQVLAKVELVAHQVRLEVERIYVDGWVKQ